MLVLMYNELLIGESSMNRKRKKRIKELNEMIEYIVISIPREIASQKFYQKAAEKASSEPTQKFFQHFVEEEKRHEANLKGILNELQDELKRLQGE